MKKDSFDTNSNLNNIVMNLTKYIDRDASQVMKLLNKPSHELN
jgi:hypothetical protein